MQYGNTVNVFYFSQEACNAYIEQNKLLNSEILELVKMRKHDSDIVKDRDT